MPKYYWRFRITNECNANCIFCHGEGFDRGTEKCYMNFNYFLEVLKRVSINDSISITGGEPLLHPKVIEMINLTVGTVNGNCHLNTNGILLSECLINISKTKLTKIHINLSTIDKFLYKKIYGISFPEKLIQSLILAKELNIIITINAVILKGINDSLSNINSLIRFCMEMSFDLCFIEPYKKIFNLKSSNSFQKFFNKILVSYNMGIVQKIPGRTFYQSNEKTNIIIAAPCSPAQAENGTFDEDAFVVMENQIIKRFNRKNIVSL